MHRIFNSRNQRHCLLLLAHALPRTHLQGSRSRAYLNLGGFFVHWSRIQPPTPRRKSHSSVCFDDLLSHSGGTEKPDVDVNDVAPCAS